MKDQDIKKRCCTSCDEMKSVANDQDRRSFARCCG